MLLYYCLLSSCLTPSGFLSQRFSRSYVMRYGAFCAVLMTLGITLSYYQGWFWCAFAFTFLLGIQAALYSPAKYGYITDLVKDNRLSWIECSCSIGYDCCDSCWHHGLYPAV